MISKGAAQSWQMENRGKTMIADKFDFGFAVDWMRKDLGICLAEARRNGATLPVTALVDQFYARVQQLRRRALGYVEPAARPAAAEAAMTTPGMQVALDVRGAWRPMLGGARCASAEVSAAERLAAARPRRGSRRRWSTSTSNRREPLTLVGAHSPVAKSAQLVLRRSAGTRHRARS